tara:strand:+ start:778 stop:2523 length:1746 start_codon:yes stop_codon:yes gene_type:complete
MASEQELKKNTNPLHKEFQKLLDVEFSNVKIKEKEIIKGTVTEILPKYVVVDAKGIKQEGMISIDEFKTGDELSKLKVGQVIEVYLERLESARSGEIVISRDKARQLKAWSKFVTAFENQEEILGEVRTRIKGGYIFYAFNDTLPLFLPSSHLSDRPLKKVDHLFNVPMRVLPVRCDKSRANGSVSRRAVLLKSKNAEVAKAIKNLKEGDVVEAEVKATTDWGVFCDINGVDALLHVSDLSHGRVKKPSDLVTIGQKIKTRIQKIEPGTNRISLSVKSLTSDPYLNIEKRYEIGKVYSGEVTSIKTYGAFIRLESGVEALCHQSEMDFRNRNVSPNQILSVSQKIKFRLLSIDKENKRISVSYKAALEENPWNQIKDQLGKIVSVRVTNVTDKSLFAETTDTKLIGMCHFRELEWHEDVNALKKYSKGDVINCRIIEIKDEKIRFSKRQADGPDPLTWFKENGKKVGSVLTTRVHEVLKTGVRVSIDKEKKLITTIKKSDLAKEVADQRLDIFVPGLKLDAKLVELDLEQRKIKLSVRAAEEDAEKSLIKRFGENATKSGATLKDIFSSAIGKKKKKKEEK